jgi:hypothetical protein
VTPDAVKADALDAISRFLHPVHGGPDGTGWQIGQAVFSSDVFRAIKPEDDVGYVASVQVRAGTPGYPGSRPFAPGDLGASVRVADYELVCAATPAEQQDLITVKTD